MAEERPLRVAHLYPDLMNLYGDRGNVIALRRRLEWHGIPYELVGVAPGDAVDLRSFDLIFFGGGQDREQRLVCQDFGCRFPAISQTRAENIRQAAAEGVAILAVCGGYQLLGRYYRTAEGEMMPGLEVLDAWTEGGSERLIGDVVAEASPALVPTAPRPTLVGFENHSGRTFLGPKAAPLARVLVGAGNNGQDRTEGAFQGSVFGTYLHGSLLPKNPWFADLLVERALAHKTGSMVRLQPLDDRLEAQAHEAAIANAMRKRGRAARA